MKMIKNILLTLAIVFFLGCQGINTYHNTIKPYLVEKENDRKVREADERLKEVMQLDREAKEKEKEAEKKAKEERQHQINAERLSNQ